MMPRRSFCLALPLGLGACATPSGEGADVPASPGAASPAHPPGRSAQGLGSGLPWEDWQEVRLPGKRPTRYARTRREGREVVHARAEASASMWRRRLQVPPEQLAQVRWAWRVERLNAQASIDRAEYEDAVARLLFAFDGEHARLSPRTQAQFELARAITGERPPYATLMYVWETAKPEGTLITNPRTERVRKIVVDSGPAHLGRWREHRRDLVADFRLAFGEDPGSLIGVALMTDADNTRSQAEAWYGPVELISGPPV